MKYGFAKILRPQESGYSGDKNKQRGKYIYLPKTCWEFFPLLKKDIFNLKSFHPSEEFSVYSILNK